MDLGISEFDFWNMTLAELERALESKKRIILQEQKSRAAFDYTLADLIGRSVARIHSSSNTMPKISDVYPTLFDGEKIDENLQAKRDELSAMRFKLFAQSFNSRKH